MSEKKASELFKSGKYHQALAEWIKLLEEDACNKEILEAIGQGKEIARGQGQGTISDDLDLISSVYRIASQGPLRQKEEGSEMGPPGDLCLYPDGRILVADETRHRIQVFSREGRLLSSFGEKGKQPGQFHYPKRLASSPEGNIYVADAWNHRVQTFNRDGSFLRTFGEYGDGPGQFNEPHGIATGHNEWIYILDRCNHRVQVFDRDFQTVGSFGRRGTPWEEDMAYLFSTPVDKFTPPAFEFPTDIGADRQGNIYITDCNNHRIQKFNPYGERIAAWGKKGSAGGDFLYPQAIAVDSRSNVFVADMNNRRVQRFTGQGEFLYSLKIPGGGSDPTMVPVALACQEGRLYVGLGFSTNILIFEYESRIPGDFQERSAEFKKRDGQTMDRSRPVEGPESRIRERKRGNSPAELMDRALHLEDTAEDLEGEAGRIKGEWEKSVDSYIPVREKRALLILQGAELDLEFDESLYALEKNLTGLEKLQKEGLTRLRRLYEGAFTLRSLILSVSDGKAIKDLTPFYERLLKRIKGLSSRLSGLLREREAILRETEEAYKIFIHRQNERRVEFKRGIHLLDGGKILISQVCSALCLSLSALKDWVVFLKKYGGGPSQWRKIFQEIYLGETGVELETIFSRAGAEWEIFDSVADEIRILAKALRHAGLESSCLQPSSFAGLFKDAGQTSRPALEPLLIPFFLGKKKDGGVSVGLCQWTFGDAQPSQGGIQSSIQVLREFSAGADNLAAPIKSFIENEMVIAQNRVTTDTLLYTGAASEENAILAQVDRLMLFNFQSQLNYQTAAKLFLSLRSDYPRLFALLFYLRGSEPERMPEISTALEKSLAKYRSLQAELRNLHKEKRAEIIATADELNLEKKKVLVREEQLNNAMGELLEYIQGGLADITGLHQRLNECALESPGSPDRGTVRRFRPEPDLIIGGGGALFGELFSPVAVAVNSKDQLFVSDVYSNRITVFNLEGLPLSAFGGYGSMPTRFIKPFSMVCDQEDNIYVAEASLIPGVSNRRVQKISPEGELILTIGGAHDDALEKPTHIFLDQSERLWITDFSRNRICLYTTQGDFIKTVGREGVDPGEFRGPLGAVQLKNGDIAVSESGNRRIQVLDSEGSHKTFCAMEGFEPGDVYKLAQGPNKTLLASDFSRHCLYVFDETYQLISVLGGFGRGPGEFHGPAGMLVHDSLLFICDIFNHRLQRFAMDRMVP